MANHNQYAQNYFSKVNENLEKASSLLAANYGLSTTSFFSLKYHSASAFYPVAHAAHAIRDLLKIVEGALLIVHALFSEPTFSNQPMSSIPTILTGMMKSAGSAIVNTLNAAASLVTFVTRTLSTLFSLGYTSSFIKKEYSDLKGKEAGGQNAETVMNMFNAMALGRGHQLLESADENLMKNTFSMR